MTSEAPRHLHPAAIAVDALRAALQLVGGIVLVAIVRGTAPGTAVLLTLAGIAGGAAIGYVGWRRTTYWIDGPALHRRSGVFTPDEKIVPSARVQSVDTTTGPLQRLLGVVELRVQVAGASDADEIVLTAVTHAEAARLRQALGQPAPAPPDELVALGLRGLLLAALTGPQISVAVSAVAGAYALLHNAIDVEENGGGLISRLDSPGAVALAAAGVLGAGYVLAFLAAIVVFAGFEVQRDGRLLRIRRGLLARRAISIPLERIDGVVIVEGLSRGPLGLAALRIESAAHGGEPAAGRTLLPLVRRSEAERVIARLVPELTLAAGELERPPPRALRRFVLWRAGTGALVGAVPAVTVDAAAWPAGPLLALAGALVGVRAYRACGVRVADSVVVVREARLARRTLLARRRRLQQHAVIHTRLQARAALADLSVTVGSGGEGRARHLERATAESVFGTLRRVASPDHY
ncbi:MAG: PH domain-containing protein [Solirubrobacteraceae bacterium]|nr:PH domain-containing protein [Solirubrobacteraceae bacterium]